MSDARCLVWVLALALLPIRASGAEPGVPVAGRVVDAVSGTPLAGARVEAGGEVAFTGVDGGFSLTVKPGLWSLKVSAQGYMDAGQELRVGAVDVVPALELALIPRSHFRDAAEVTAPSTPSAPAALPV